MTMSQSRVPGTPSLLRAINDRAALELLLDRGPLTRAQLGELTGLSKVTASQLVERLEDRQLGLPRRRARRRPRAQRPALRGRAEQRVRRRRRGRTATGCRGLGGHHGRHDRPGRGLPPRRRDPVGIVHAAVIEPSGARVPRGTGYGGSCSEPQASWIPPPETSPSRSISPSRARTPGGPARRPQAPDDVRE